MFSGIGSASPDISLSATSGTSSPGCGLALSAGEAVASISSVVTREIAAPQRKQNRACSCNAAPQREQNDIQVSPNSAPISFVKSISRRACDGIERNQIG